MSGGLGVLTVRSVHLNESTFIRSAGTISALSAHARGAVFYPLSKRGGVRERGVDGSGTDKRI